MKHEKGMGFHGSFLGLLLVMSGPLLSLSRLVLGNLEDVHGPIKARHETNITQREPNIGPSEAQLLLPKTNFKPLHIFIWLNKKRGPLKSKPLRNITWYYMIQKNTGHYKVQTLTQHDIRQAYKFKWFCAISAAPATKCVFSRLLFHEKRHGNKKKSIKFSHHGIQTILLKYSPIFHIFRYFSDTRLELYRGNFLSKIFCFLDVDVRTV